MSTRKRSVVSSSHRISAPFARNKYAAGRRSYVRAYRVNAVQGFEIDKLRGFPLGVLASTASREWDKAVKGERESEAGTHAQREREKGGGGGVLLVVERFEPVVTSRVDTPAFDWLLEGTG